MDIVPCSIVGTPEFILRTVANEEGRGHRTWTIIEIATDAKLRRCASVEGWRLGRGQDQRRGARVVSQHIDSLAIIVREYDEAINWYCGVLGFTLVEDTPVTDTKRWVRVAPADSLGSSLLLARAASPEQSMRIGNQTGGRVFLFLKTDDFWRDYHALSSKGVVFRRAPSEELYGTVAVFEDLYGNLWDLIEPRMETG